MTGWDTTVDGQSGDLKDDLAPVLDRGKIVEPSGFVDPKMSTRGYHEAIRQCSRLYESPPLCAVAPR
jgi:hypothetical protein